MLRNVYQQNTTCFLPTVQISPIFVQMEKSTVNHFPANHTIAIIWTPKYLVILKMAIPCELEVEAEVTKRHKEYTVQQVE